MKRTSNRRFRFWREMKRRGVPRVLAMYAATAFIVIEASDIILPRLGMPDWTVTLMIILLIVGFPVAFVLSWVFDITPQGVVKTEPIGKGSLPEQEDQARRRKLRISDVVIGVLLMVVIVLVYPKIFNQGKSRIPKEIRGKISIAVMPFKNVTGDTIYSLWQEGMQNLLITSLSNSEELSVRQFETMNSLVSNKAGINYASLTPSLAGEMARKVEANTVISGNLHKSGNKVRITVNIMNTETEEIYKSYEMEGYGEDDLFDLADSLSTIIRDYLEITNMKQNQLFDVAHVFTSSPEAYKYYLQGFDCHGRLDYACAADFYSKAIQVDSNFVSAMMKLAYCYADQRQAELSKYWAYQAFERIDRLPADMQLMVHAVKSFADKKPLDQLEYARQYLEYYPHSAYMTYMLGWLNFNLEQWEESIEGFEKSLDLLKKMDKHPWAWTYILLGGAYHNIGSHKQEQKVFEEGRELWPQQKSTFDYWQAICALSIGDSAGTNYYLDEIRKMIEQKGRPEAYLWLWYAGVHDLAESYERAEFYFRQARSLRPDDPYIANDFARFLISRDIDVDEGMELITPIVEAHPENASFLYTYGLGLFKTKRYQEADEVLEKSWDLTPYYDHKQFTLGKKVGDLLDMN